MRQKQCNFFLAFVLHRHVFGFGLPKKRRRKRRAQFFRPLIDTCVALLLPSSSSVCTDVCVREKRHSHSFHSAMVSFSLWRRQLIENKYRRFSTDSPQPPSIQRVVGSTIAAAARAPAPLSSDRRTVLPPPPPPPIESSHIKFNGLLLGGRRRGRVLPGEEGFHRISPFEGGIAPQVCSLMGESVTSRSTSCVSEWIDGLSLSMCAWEGDTKEGREGGQSPNQFKGRRGRKTRKEGAPLFLFLGKEGLGWLDGGRSQRGDEIIIAYSGRVFVRRAHLVLSTCVVRLFFSFLNRSFPTFFLIL